MSSAAMLTESHITIRAPRQRVFEVTSDVESWPEHLPHYRYVRVMERTEGAAVLKMACWRGVIPIAWTSRFSVHPEAWEIRFEHLRAWTKGMRVVWRYEELADGGTAITLSHELAFRWPPLAPLAEAVIGGFFIEHIAGRTLATFKHLMEKERV